MGTRLAAAMRWPAPRPAAVLPTVAIATFLGLGAYPSAVQASGQPPAVVKAPSTISAGVLTLELNPASRTAHLFHVVDQLSGWSQFSHAQYRRHFEQPEKGGLSEADEKLLAEHAAIRKRKGYGQGPEQTFYTPLELDDALKVGVKAGYLTQAEADTERRVFRHFAPRIEVLMHENAAQIAAFARNVSARQEELAAFATKAGRLSGVASITVPVYLFANPDDSRIGGGYNGGVLTLEVPRKRDAFPSFLHEVFHAFLDRRKSDLAKAASTIPGLNAQTLNEGLAYALSPGLLHTSGAGADPLADRVRADIGKPITDSYTRYNRYGLALRPLVKAALEDEKQNLDTLLPRAVDAWRVLAEVSLALEGSGAARQPGGTRRHVYSFGPGWEALNDLANRKAAHLTAYNYSTEYYERSLRHAAPGTPVIFLYALDSTDRSVTPEFARLFPYPLSEIEAALRRGESVEVKGQGGGFNVVLLAAPTVERLRRLIGETNLLNGDGIWTL